MSKLSEEEVKQIRKMLSETDMTQKDIAQLFNVQRGHISAIKTRKRWRHVK